MNTTRDTESNAAPAVADLWRYYDEHAEHARYHEGLRATVSSTLAAIAAAVVGLAGIGGLSAADVPAGLVVVVLSSLGVALSIKHYERFKMHTAIMGAIRSEMDRASGLNTSELRKRGRTRHAQEFSVFGSRRRTAEARPAMDPAEGTKAKRSPWVDRVRLHVLWLGLPVCVGLIGVLVIILSFVGVAPE